MPYNVLILPPTGGMVNQSELCSRLISPLTVVMNVRLHPKLEKQLNELGLDRYELPQALLERVSDTYDRTLEAKPKAIESKYTAIIEGLQIGIIETDTEGRITKVFRRFLEMTGYSADELLGRHPLDVFVDQAHQEIVGEVEVARNRGELGVWEARVRNKAGEELNLMISGAPIRNDDGEVIGSIGLHFDVTEHVQRANELQAARRYAEEALKVQKSFLANISHELRTPLNAITGLSRLLETAGLDSEQRRYLSAIQSSADDLLLMINDLLDVARITSGKFNLDVAPFDLGLLLERSEWMMQAAAKEKGVRLEYHIHQPFHAHFVGDALRIGQVLTNLVGNAIKFTEFGGSVTVQVQIHEHAGFKLTVSDTGKGIDDSKIEQVFDPFKQEDDTVTRKYGGTGLGLSICRQLVQLHQGSITVNSVKGEGSTFTVEVPLERVELAPVPEQGKAHAFNGFSVLVVEDNEMNRLVARATLESWGLNVHEVNDGFEALRHVHRSNFDLLLVDLQMPGISGAETVRRLRTEQGNHVPVIALTANAYAPNREAFRTAGIDHLMLKPFNPYELNLLLNDVLSCHLRTPLTLNFDQLNRLIQHSKANDRNTFITELAGGMKKLTEKFSESVHTKNTAEGERIAHALRPLAGFAGLDELVRHLEIYEQMASTHRHNYIERSGENIVESLKQAVELLENVG